jgi:hypothetical protein
VARFKRDELGVPEAEIIDDVGPRTVVRLDEIAAATEATLDLGAVLIAPPGLDVDSQAALRAEIEQAGATVLLGLGDLALVIGGAPAAIDALTPLVGQLLAGVVTPGTMDLPGDLDEDTVALIQAWLTMLDPVFVFDQTNPNRFGGSFEAFGGCGQELVL